MPAVASISGGPFPSLVKFKIYGLHSLGEMWIVTEGEDCSNHSPHKSGQLQIGSCLTDLRIEDCPKLVVKPHFPISLKHLWLKKSSNNLLLSPCQGHGSSSSSNFAPSFSNLKLLQLWHTKASLPLSPPPSPGFRLELLQHTTALESLEIFRCSDLIELPKCLGNLSSLQRMTIKDCDRLNGLPQSIGQLTSLELIIEDCHAFVQFPESLGELRSLRWFEIRGLRVLTSLPESLCHLTSLKEVSIENCHALVQLPEGLGELCSLSKLDIWLLPGQTCLPQSLRRLMPLQELEIRGCIELGELPECLGELHGLRTLNVWRLDSMTCLPQSLCRLATSLKELQILACPGLTSLPGWIKGLTALRLLEIEWCPDLERRCERGKGEDWHLISHIPSSTDWLDRQMIRGLSVC